MNEKESKKSLVIPDWILMDENYIPPNDHDGFLQKTQISVLSVLSRIKNEKEYIRQGNTAPAIRIASAVFIIILLSLSKNMMFPALMTVGILLRLAMLNGNQIKRILGSMLTSVFISGLILLPAAIWGNLHTFFYITVKISASVTLLGILAATISWNQMTSGLKLFHLPDVIIFTLDITMKYIMLLGEICFQMIQALKVRCIGKNARKSGALSGILGMTFLKSKELSEEMYQAMECRGFDGTYMILKKKTSLMRNAWYLTGVLLIGLVFLKLEGYL